MHVPHDFSDQVNPHTRRSVRWLLIGAGVILTGLGIAGVILPLVPGMPFLLLAAACFARANKRLYNWLLNHRIVGPPLHAWRNHRRIPRRVKPRAVLAVLIAFGTSAWFALENPVHQALWFAVGLGVALFILRLPSYDERLAAGRSAADAAEEPAATEHAS